MRILGALESLARWVLLLLGAIAIAIIGAADYYSGYEVSFSIFYVLPILAVGWCAGRRWAVAYSLLGAAVWLVADVATHPEYSHWLIILWNALVRLGFFLMVSLTASGLRAARRMEEQLTQFIVHDLRTPVASVGMSLNVLRRRKAGLDEQQLSLIELASGSIQWMETLITSLLYMARLDSGRMPVDPQPVAIPELVARARDHLTAWSQGNGVTLETRLPKGPLVALADRDLALRALVNLIANAVKFAPENSTVTVAVRLHELHGVAVSVTDRGPGVPREWLRKVFDRFEQVEGRKRGAIGGTGLGLAFCRMAIEAQGGHIWMESVPDEATTVTFVLPAMPREAHQQDGH